MGFLDKLFGKSDFEIEKDLEAARKANKENKTKKKKTPKHMAPKPVKKKGFFS